MPTPAAVIHPGTQHSWQTAHALQELDRLAFYATSIFYRPDHWPYRVERHLPGRLARAAHGEFRRFHHPGIDPALVRTFGLEEWLERIANRLGHPALGSWFNRRGNDRFVHKVARDLRSDRPFHVWSYDGVAAPVLRLARQEGRRAILDRTIGDWRAFNDIMARLREEHGEFVEDREAVVSDLEIERQDEEYAAADVILLGSEFAARTVRTHARAPGTASKVRVLTYGCDAALFDGGVPRTPLPGSEPVRFLFLGQIGVRKGAHLLLEAIRRVPPSAASFTFVGRAHLPRDVFARYADRVVHRPAIARADVPAIMADHDVLVFPSCFEGAGLVLYEALSAGLALIQSRNADIAVTADTGLLLDELSVGAVYEALMVAIDDRQRLRGWQAAAPAAAATYTFAAYRDRIAGLLDELEV